MPREKVSQEVRDAFRAFRYLTGHSSTQIAGLAGVSDSTITHIEKGQSVSPGKVLTIIQRAWGIQTLEDLLEKAKGQHQPTDDELHKRFPQRKTFETKGRASKNAELTKEVCDVFRAYRYYKGHSTTKLEELSGVPHSIITNIENYNSVSKDKVLTVIQKAWGVETLEDLVKRGRGLPSPPKKKMSEKYKRNPDSRLEK